MITCHLIISNDNNFNNKMHKNIPSITGKTQTMIKEFKEAIEKLKC